MKNFWKSYSQFKTQREMFLFISQNRPKYSFVSNELLGVDLTASNFAHVLPKAEAKYPLFKCYEKNIALLTRDEHFLWDQRRHSIDTIKQPGWLKLFSLEKELKAEYEYILSFKMQN